MFRSSRFTLLALLACCASLLGAAPAAAIDVCGNGICATNAVPPENATNCPVDCGSGTDCLIDTCDNGACSEPTTGVDSDYDGLPDLLEYQLAHKFFPTTLLQWHDEDRSESYLFRSRSTPYTMIPYYHDTECVGDRACIEVRYGITFFYDHGDTAADLYEHVGDSETYAALLRRRPEYANATDDPKGWELIRDFTSAHWGETYSDSSVVGAYGSCPEPCGAFDNDPAACNAHSTCRATPGSCSGGPSFCWAISSEKDCRAVASCTWSSACYKKFDWECYGDQPLDAQATIFSAESKHALYHTDDECDGGGFWNSDDCPNNQYDMRQWKDRNLQNVGNPGFAAFDTTIQDPSGCGLYQVWGGAKFGEASPYLQHFLRVIDWALD